MENTREELAVSRRPETEGQNKISGDGRGGRPPRRSGGKSIRILENGRKETEKEKEAEKEIGKESGAAEAWLDEDFGDGGDFEEIAEEIQEELEIRRDGFEERQREDSGGRFTSTGEFLRLLKPTDAYLAAFFVPIIVMVIIFAQRGIFPFGEESFLRTDMYHQYAPFFSEFQYKLTQGGSLLYSWDVGMGVNFSALYAYYLASPFNWLLVLCPKDMIIEFMSYGIVLKIGLAGLSFTWYLKRHCKTRDFGAGLLWNFLRSVWLCGGLQLEYYVAGLHNFTALDSSGAGAPGKRRKALPVLPGSGSFHPVQLLYFHYDLPVSGAVHGGAADSGAA